MPRREGKHLAYLTGRTDKAACDALAQKRPAAGGYATVRDAEEDEVRVWSEEREVESLHGVLQVGRVRGT